MAQVLGFLIFLCAFILVQHPVFGKDKSYTMICQGGGSMTAVFDRSIRFDRPDLYSTTIRFARAPRAAGEHGPKPGHCAWLDRPVADTEPAVLVFQRKGKNPIWQLDFSLGNVVLKSADTEEFALINAVHKGEQFIIKARREGDLLRITKVGP